MKYFVAMAIMAAGIYGLTTGGAAAWTEPGQVLEHHSTAHSLGPCGIHPCPPKPKGKPKGR